MTESITKAIMTNIYLGIKGKVIGRFTVGKVYECVHYGMWYDPLVLNSIGNHCDNCLYKYKSQGYTDQKYALEILDFEVVYYTIADNYGKLNAVHHGSYDYVVGYGDDDGSNTKIIKCLPQSFQYIIDPITGEKAILMSIHQKWYDKIKDGSKKYEFRNILPKLLR